MESRIMALSYTSLSGGGGAATNDFNINVGASGYTNVSLTTTFPAGSYICTSSLSDATLDVYLINEDGTSAGYANATTASTTIVASKSFNKVVIYGATNNDILVFQFLYVFNTSDIATNVAAAARLISTGTASLPNINNTTVLTGQNFATDVEVTFTGSDSVARNAKSVTRTSSTSLTVTRPDDMPTTFSPYTITATNPGIAPPTSSNAHKLINSATVGAAPVWVTSSTLPTFFVNLAYSTTLSATDADGGSSITYSIASGSLPSSMTLNSSTGVISGTSSSASPGSFTIRATDSGGNFVDRAFTMARQTVPVAPTSVAGTKTSTVGSISVAFTAPTTGYTPTSYTVTSSPGSITATGSSSPIVVSGLTGGTSYTFTVTSTSAQGTSAASSASSAVTAPTTLTTTFNSSGTFTNPGVSNVEVLLVGGGGGGGFGGSNLSGEFGGGGGGAGGVQYSAALSISPNTNYAVTVGNGGGGDTSGNSSVFANLTALGGERGANSTANARVTANSGFGSGGGGATVSNNSINTNRHLGGSGTSGQGKAGSNAQGNNAGGGGGALNASPNSTGNTVSNAYYGVPGGAVTYFGSKYAAGGGGANPYSPYTSGDGLGGASGSAGDSRVDNFRPFTLPGAGANGTGTGGGGGCGWVSIINSNSQNTPGASGGNGVVILKYVG
jgi:hypothetical protein